METSQGSVNSIPVTFTYHAEDGGLNFLSPSFVEPLDVADPHGAVPETGYISADQIVQIRPRPDFNPYIPEFMIFFTITEKLPEDDKRTIPDIQLKIYTCTGLPKGFVETHYGQVDKKWELPKWLRVAEENLHVIVSTKAGTGKALEFHNNVVKPALMYSGLTHIATRKTKTQKDVYTFAKNAIRTKASEGVRKTIILLSGDGGVSDILNGIAGIEKMRFVSFPPLYAFTQ